MPSNLAQFDSGPDHDWLTADAEQFIGWDYEPVDDGRPWVVYVSIPAECLKEPRWSFRNWWDAMAFAMETAERRGLYFEGRNGHGLA